MQAANTGHVAQQARGMPMKRKRSNPRPVAALLVFLTAALFISASAAQAAPPFEPRILLPADPDAVVISYTEIPDLLANPDRTPRIRVYGDGEVLVHYPVYMKRAGDYRMYLNPGEVRRLLLTVSGVIGFDAKLAAQARREERLARFNATGIVTERSDEVLERIELKLDGFQGSAAASMRPVNERAEWRDIGPDAREFPGLPGMRGVSGARNALLELLEHPDLERLP